MDHPLNLNQQHDQHIQEVLESLRKTSKNLQNKYYIAYKTNFNETIIKSLLDLELESISLIVNDPYLLNLSKLLSNLKTQLEAHQALFGSYNIVSIAKRQVKNYEISNTACSIEKEIQIWFDRRLVQDVAVTLDDCHECLDDEKLIKALIGFKNRVSAVDFDSDLQDLILKAGIFTLLETIVSDSQNSTRLREQCGMVISSLVQFNKDVFVGLVLMGQIYRNLVTMATCESIQVLTCLVKLIKSPLIDELESNGEIRKIVALLDQANDEEISSTSRTFRALVMDCLLEITYFGRQDVIEAILREGIVEKLMGLQRETSATKSPEVALERCAVKFAVQVEVGEGMNGKERREVKLEILKRVRESSVSDSEAANVVAEVLWGSSPMNF